MRALEQHSYLLPPDFTAERLARKLAPRFETTLDAPTQVRRLFLDSFDWRLFQAGLCLQFKTTDGGQSLQLESLAAGKPVAGSKVDAAPAWPADIPAGELRDQIASRLAMRVLLPLVRVDSRGRVLRILNEDQKTVVRLWVEEAVCRRPDGRGESRSLLSRVTVVPVRGYDADRDELEQLLTGELELPGAPGNPFHEALTACGREPGDYSSKLDVELQPGMRADAAARRIFLCLLDTLEANIEGTRADLDSEFLHDLRVATRRTRSALSQIKAVLPTEVTDDYKQRFGWLGQITGPTRDLDVFLLEIPRYRDSLPGELRPALEPFHRFLETHQQEEQRALGKRLGSPHFRKLVKSWRAYLETELPEKPLAANAARPVKAVADERIWKMFRRVLKEGREITDASPHEDLHELRKSCKKLRYLIEFFQALYPAKQTRPLIKALKSLLDNLGAFQDLEVQAHKLEHFAEQMQAEGAVPLPTLLAMGALIGDLLRLQGEARHEFHGRFEHFDVKGNRDAYRRLFRSSLEGEVAA